MIKKEMSFNDRLKAGHTKTEIMEYYNIKSEEAYNKVLSCLDKIHAGVKL